MRAVLIAGVTAIVLSLTAVFGAPPPAAARTHPAGTKITAKPDFNGDGYADLAVGVPYESFAGKTNAGGVNVIYGSASGLAAARNQFWTQDSPGVVGVAQPEDLFGWSLAAADFNNDGYSDLAVGIRFKVVNGVKKAGGVTVLYGSPTGLTATGSQFWTQSSPGILDTAEPGDQFGYSLVADDFNGDGNADLAVGSPFEDLLGTDEGAVNVIYGSSLGLRSAGNQFWTQDSPGIPDRSESGDRFGKSLATGDFNGDGRADLAIGVPYESFGGVNRAGRVHIIFGSPQRLTAAGTQLWDETTPGINNSPVLRDQFGQSLAAGDFNHDGHDDLAVGIWFKDFTYIGNQGAMQVIYGSATGLTATGNQFWSQNSPGILDTAEQGDQFSQTLAAGDYNADGYADIAVGVPWEDLHSSNVNLDQGAVNVIYGTASGLTATGNQKWTQDSPGILDVAERADHFSESLGAADFNGDGSADLAVGVPWEDLTVANQGAVNVIYGSKSRLTAAGNQLWSQDSPGIKEVGEPYDRFGWSISSGTQRAGTPRVCYGNAGGTCG